MTQIWRRLRTQFGTTIPLLLAATALSGFSAAAAEEDNQPAYNLMLFGSAPQICSSMNQDACESVDWIEANEMRTDRLFNLSDVRRKEAMRRAIWPRDRDEIRDELTEALDMMADHFGYGVVSETRLVERFRSRAHLHLLTQLSEAEYYRVLDSLEMPTVEGLREHVSLEETADSSALLLRRYVELTAANSGQETPRIYVVTAAARDALGAYEAYQRPLQAAGADVHWLPVDATVMQAQREGLCESLDSLRRSVNGTYDRARVHPGLHTQQQEFCTDNSAWRDIVEQADGVFFADGDASLLRRAFFVSDTEPGRLLSALQEKFTGGDLTVAGAGAGTIALSSGTMITNGTSREAMTEGSLSRPAPQVGCDQDNSCPRGVNPNSLTYHAMGGLGFYPYGLIDVDVSQRGRQGRMLRLAADTAQPLATGVDRATALLVDTRSGEFTVLGDNAVFFVERATGNEQMAGGGFHFLRHQSTGRITRNQVEAVELAEQRPYRPESVSVRFLESTGVYDNIARLCEGREQMQLLQEDFIFLMQQGEDTQTLRVQGRCQVVNGTVGIAWQPEAVR